ncbi:two-component sensor histidine kinase (plasmid) [Leptolyngbya sp. NK1-12]|jgi:two-component system, OmpR family, Ni(II)-sensor and/or redox sensor kinase NrsS|uniref:histidine kinase n=1 Tax=Leptolyngbya sp. NK1-12 TaxID=2547451 RepID=A0AA96WZN2_9CYAN|nr:two-component system sensor histidine kinase RppB [Leptolyngbya sp. NK1-12]WNZ28047.1 two-component sensor histidine kinase [Leptolyngbya sp. NK1-12]
MNSHQLFRRSRTRLALWYALVMGAILSLSGLGMYRSLVQSNWAAMEREMESIAGTLHDSLEPMLPASEDPTAVLRRILPELCLAGQPCNTSPTLIQRHTTGISDRSIYYIRLFDHSGKLLAFSPNQPPSLPKTLNRSPWQTFHAANGVRYHQFTTILHSAYANHQANEPSSQLSWGYLQIGRTLATFDAETKRIQWILVIGFPIALLLVGFSSWWLSGLAMQPIYQSYQQQQQFIANAAHELRSPLASLLATVEAILRLPPTNQHNIPVMLQTVERQGRRLSHLIADLLFLTSLEQNSSPKPFQPCCLNDLISDLTEEFLELATIADIHLTHQIPNHDVYVLGNESQLYRLVSNLIANAIQYTTLGGSVMVSLEQRDRTAVIAVKDTGIGIPTEQQGRVFDRFYRVDGDRSRKTGGTGLGLAIAQAIAQKHQAILKVESQVGQGSIFTLEIAIVNN